MEWILCKVVESSCLLNHDFAPHISWHDLPHHRTMKKYGDSQSMEAFLLHPLKFAIQTWFCNCPQNLYLFHIVFECIPRKHDQGKMWVRPDRLLSQVLSTSGQCFVSSQPVKVVDMHRQELPFFLGVRTSIPNCKPSPNRTSIGFSQIAFPITVPAKG